MQYKLKTSKEIDQGSVNIQEYLFSILKERGIDEPEKWLNASKADEHDPSLLPNVDMASELLHEELSKAEPMIYLQVD